ncbi:DUF6477 family protein [Pseudohalocynthiibacter aestuariivivens]|jgi:Family of unknown function (DUF6477)|uniref:DUF6477 family protein n=1 Tax=Pseudohalocynthiibacter aestuariivivens TaxID=1591409 RepID=A0ABV5JFZ2_9RHOB|nr:MULTISPECIES: DUF6477 family protein [Pseudohalocynthiibacter]MBS9716279.1 hypothetical protein [Pseudohalocynthiibacter aestuariivivens]MCK0100913.1 DUF6477 family protein [Pseudohalocynthiibacter sp. F2068]
MSDLMKILKSLRRPGLLMRAARLGSADYRRERDLRRVLKSRNLPMPETAISNLLSEEDILEEKRKTGDADYSITRHVDIMIALVSEASLVLGKRQAN